MNYNQNFQLVLGLVLACMIFAVALELKWIAFRGIWKRPIGVLAGMLGQWIFLPWLTLGIVLTYFQSNIDMALIAAFWGVWHAVSGLILVFYWRSKPNGLSMESALNHEGGSHSTISKKDKPNK